MAPEHSPGHSSLESFEGDEEPHSTHWHDHPSPHSATQPQSQAPLQKRRRVTRACDECRRKKIKCDGKQPCTHCTVYSYECTYDQPSNRRRNPTPQYIEALENRLQRAETLLATLMPSYDLNDPNLGTAASHVGQSKTAGKTDHANKESEQDAQLRSMITTTGQLDLDETGRWDFHGGSSGAVFVKRMREQFGGLLGDLNTPVLPRIPRPLGLIDSPRSSMESPLEAGLPNTMDLPSREAARTLCEASLDFGCALLRFVHKPSFYEMFDSMYDTPVESYGDQENRFLPLLYTVLAFGCMFQQNLVNDTNANGGNSYNVLIDEGYKYFRAARQMMELTESRDLVSLQAILFMILFLQATSNLSTCYSYIGVAQRSALRMGLHRNLAENFNPIERETRRRVFWVVRKMDTYVSALLGFPMTLSNDDIDQELPLEIDDEYITKEEIKPMPPGTTSVIAASNAHSGLMEILTRVIKSIYPLKGLEQSVKGSASCSYSISHGKIRDIEKDLNDWLDKLPMALRPGGETLPELLRVQHLLRLAYGHVQMMLYRPFLHYVSEKSCAGKNVDERSYACAAAGVSVSRNIVHICAEMERRGLLVGAYWFTMYTTFFAILALIYFVLENPNKPESENILADANDGRATLKALAKRSQAADRCSIALDGLYKQLPSHLRASRSGGLITKKKRSATSSNTAGSQPVSRVPAAPRDAANPLSDQNRAMTFPLPASQNGGGLPTTSFDDLQFQNSALLPKFALKHGFQELVSPTDMSSIGTPDSTGTGSSQQQPYDFQPCNVNNGLPDFSAMMFPSADPFAYPNQPMTEFDAFKQEDPTTLLPLSYLADETTSSNVYDNLEGQLFGPIPPYLMQGQPNYDPSSQVDPGISSLMSQDVDFQTQMADNSQMNFEGIFPRTDASQWNNMIINQQPGP